MQLFLTDLQECSIPQDINSSGNITQEESYISKVKDLRKTINQLQTQEEKIAALPDFNKKVALLKLQFPDKDLKRLYDAVECLKKNNSFHTEETQNIIKDHLYSYIHIITASLQDKCKDLSLDALRTLHTLLETVDQDTTVLQRHLYNIITNPIMMNVMSDNINKEPDDALTFIKKLATELKHCIDIPIVIALLQKIQPTVLLKTIDQSKNQDILLSSIIKLLDTLAIQLQKEDKIPAYVKASSIKDINQIKNNMDICQKNNFSNFEKKAIQVSCSNDKNEDIISAYPKIYTFKEVLQCFGLRILMNFNSPKEKNFIDLLFKAQNNRITTDTIKSIIEDGTLNTKMQQCVAQFWLKTIETLRKSNYSKSLNTELKEAKVLHSKTSEQLKIEQRRENQREQNIHFETHIIDYENTFNGDKEERSDLLVKLQEALPDINNDAILSVLNFDEIKILINAYQPGKETIIIPLSNLLLKMNILLTNNTENKYDSILQSLHGIFTSMALSEIECKKQNNIARAIRIAINNSKTLIEPSIYTATLKSLYNQIIINDDLELTIQLLHLYIESYDIPNKDTYIHNLQEMFPTIIKKQEDNNFTFENPLKIGLYDLIDLYKKDAFSFHMTNILLFACLNSSTTVPDDYFTPFLRTAWEKNIRNDDLKNYLLKDTRPKKHLLLALKTWKTIAEQYNNEEEIQFVESQQKILN